jgi:Fe2+ transport system protein FeoA
MERRERNIGVPLTTLRAGETCLIINVGFNPSSKRRRTQRGFVKRLTDLGLTPGTPLRVVKAAPFRGPIEIVVRGSRLALGRGMAERILVKAVK